MAGKPGRITQELKIEDQNQEEKIVLSKELLTIKMDIKCIG